MLPRDFFLQPDALKPGKVYVSEWNDTVYVAQLTADERDQLEDVWQQIKGDTNVGFRAFVVAFTLCDEKNVRYFMDVDAVRASMAALGKKNAGPVVKVFNVACAKNGLTKSDVDELEKNSETPLAVDGNGA